MKNLLILLSLIFIYTVSYASTASINCCNPKETSKSTIDEKPPLGKKAPRIIVEDINGKWINSKKWKGKVIVLNFWFTTCPPCIKEMPQLNKLYDSYKDNDNVEFLAITFQKKGQVQFFLLQNELNLPVVPNEYETASSFRVSGHPTNIVINKEGLISFYEKGYKNNIYELMDGAIKEAL